MQLNKIAPPVLICALLALIGNRICLAGERFKDLDQFTTITSAQDVGFMSAPDVPLPSQVTESSKVKSPLFPIVGSQKTSLPVAYLLLQNQKYEQAELCLTEILNDDHENWMAYRLRAMARLQEQDYDGAIDDASSALRINQLDISMLNLLGVALLDSDNPKEALAVSQEALDLFPESREARTIQAQAARDLDR